MGRRPNRVLAAVVAAIALLALVTGVVSATRSTTRYDRGTPEGVAQAYLDAVIDGDLRKAVGLLAEDSGCTVQDLGRARAPGGLRALLLDARVDGDTARVDVDLERSSAGPFDTFAFTEEHTFHFVRADGQWRIRGAPWPMFECGGGT